jgi:hypothetical protein
MSGPSSSDLINRRKFLITERQDPLPCCAPSSVYFFSSTDISGSIATDSSGSAALISPTELTITTINPVFVTGLVTLNGTVGDVIVMSVVYSISPSAIEYTVIPGTTVTLPASGYATLFEVGSFTPPKAGIYTFTLRLRQTVGTGARYLNAVLYAQGT